MVTPKEFTRLREQRQRNRIAEIQSEIRARVRAGWYRPHFSDGARDTETYRGDDLWSALVGHNIKK